MNLWRKTTGLLKDQNSIWAANFSKRSPLRNPDIDEAVIKATNHDENRVDYKHSRYVFAWVRMSPAYLKPLIWSISNRMEKTRSWVVALKGLMLLNGVFSSKVVAVQTIGRLPFNLSDFEDGYSDNAKTLAHNAFIRAYYSFLDQKSTFIFQQAQEFNALQIGMLDLQQQQKHALAQEIVRVQNNQILLDMLLQIKPLSEDIIGVIMLEAMDYVIIEIKDIYSKICNGISKIMKILSSSCGKEEAEVALKIVKKASIQCDQLSAYFEFCKEIRVINSSESPRFQRIADVDIKELETIVKNVALEIKYPVPEEEGGGEKGDYNEKIESVGH